VLIRYFILSWMNNDDSLRTKIIPFLKRGLNDFQTICSDPDSFVRAKQNDSKYNIVNWSGDYVAGNQNYLQLITAFIPHFNFIRNQQNYADINQSINQITKCASDILPIVNKF